MFVIRVEIWKEIEQQSSILYIFGCEHMSTASALHIRGWQSRGQCCCVAQASGDVVITMLDFQSARVKSVVGSHCFMVVGSGGQTVLSYCLQLTGIPEEVASSGRSSTDAPSIISIHLLYKQSIPQSLCFTYAQNADILSHCL